MKKLITVLTLVSTLSAFAQKADLAAASKDKSGNLIGIVEKEHFLEEPFKGWFDFGYDDYTPDAEIMKQLKPLLKKVHIKAFIGTWCGDSQEQTPIFYKILDAAEFKYKNLEMITLNRGKKNTG